LLGSGAGFVSLLSALGLLSPKVIPFMELRPHGFPFKVTPLCICQHSTNRSQPMDKKLTCTACDGDLHDTSIGLPLFKFNDKFCSHICSKYGKKFENREPANIAPQTPEEVRQRIEAWNQWMDMSHEEGQRFIDTHWANERQHRRNWVRQTNQDHEAYKARVVQEQAEHDQREHAIWCERGPFYRKRLYTPPPYVQAPYKSILPFPLTVFPEPMSDWAKKEFDRCNPKCPMGYIHSEAANGGEFLPCQVVHSSAIERGCVFLGSTSANTTYENRWKATHNMMTQTY
jgi:hypothetical protein